MPAKRVKNCKNTKRNEILCICKKWWNNLPKSAEGPRTEHWPGFCYNASRQSLKNLKGLEYLKWLTIQKWWIANILTSLNGEIFLHVFEIFPRFSRYWPWFSYCCPTTKSQTGILFSWEKRPGFTSTTNHWLCTSVSANTTERPLPPKNKFLQPPHATRTL